MYVIVRKDKSTQINKINTIILYPYSPFHERPIRRPRAKPVFLGKSGLFSRGMDYSIANYAK